jgi:hypothetical protein
MEFARLRPMSATEILDGAFTLYRRHFLTFVVTSLLAMLPSLLVSAIAADQMWINLVPLAGFLVSTGALVHQVSEAALGRKPRLGEAFRVAAARFFPLLLATVIYFALLTAGLIALLVPGFCLYCMMFAYAPVVVLEKRTNFLRRSRALAKEQWGKVSGVMLLATIITVLPSVALHVGAMGILDVGIGAAMRSPGVKLGSLLLTALDSPFNYAVMTLLYYDQRIRKDGLDVQLAVDAMSGASRQPALQGAASAAAR